MAKKLQGSEFYVRDCTDIVLIHVYCNETEKCATNKRREEHLPLQQRLRRFPLQTVNSASSVYPQG